VIHRIKKGFRIRGYDQAGTGVALMDGNKLNVYKRKVVLGLEEAISETKPSCACRH
jgi:hypothetical protein